MSERERVCEREIERVGEKVKLVLYIYYPDTNLLIKCSYIFIIYIVGKSRDQLVQCTM